VVVPVDIEHAVFLVRSQWLTGGFPTF